MNEEIESENVRIHSRADELIACLEGEIAKRDARIMGLESQYQRDVYGLNNEGDPIGGEPAGGYANDNARLRAELAAIKAQEPVIDAPYGGILRIEAGNLPDSWVRINPCKLYAVPVSEAKAQGVVMPEHETSTPSSKWASAGEPDPHGKAYDCERAELSMGEYTDDELANAVFMHDHRSFDIAATMRGEPGSIVLLTAAKDRIRWLSRSLDKALAHLNAAPVQQVSAPDVSAMARTLADRNADACNVNREDNWAIYGQDYIDDVTAMLAAAPAAPAADAGGVLEQAMYTLISIGYHENSGLVHELRQALAAHSAKGVV